MDKSSSWPKMKSKESPIMFQVRKLYYKIINWLSETPQYEGVTGYGLFDREFLDTMRWMDDPDPYIRGLVPDLGYKTYLLEYTQINENLENPVIILIAILILLLQGSLMFKKAIKIATMAGLIMSSISFILALVYLILKLVYWDSFAMGTAPI